MQDGIQTGLIYNGAVVKDAPGISPIDLIYDVNANSSDIDLSSPLVVTNLTPITTGDPLAPTEAPPIAPNVMAIPAPAEDTKKSHKILFVGAGLGALMLLSKDSKKAAGLGSIGKGKKKTSLLPLLLVGGAAALYYFSKSENGIDDPEAAGLVVVPGLAKLTEVERDAVFARTAGWVNPHGGYYPEIYRDVLLLGLPLYADIWRKMSQEETTQIYQLVIDHPAGLLQAENPLLYSQVQAIKEKYNLKFY
jgi:hypothetical protein